MKDDPTIERIRKIRHKISEIRRHDPEQLIRYYMELQKQHENRLMQAVDPSVSGQLPPKDGGLHQ